MLDIGEVVFTFLCVSNSVADLDPGSGMGKKSRSGFGIRTKG